jgi:hypothetical protein
VHDRTTLRRGSDTLHRLLLNPAAEPIRVDGYRPTVLRALQVQIPYPPPTCVSRPDTSSTPSVPASDLRFSTKREFHPPYAPPPRVSRPSASSTPSVPASHPRFSTKREFHTLRTRLPPAFLDQTRVLHPPYAPPTCVSRPSAASAARRCAATSTQGGLPPLFEALRQAQRAYRCPLPGKEGTPSQSARGHSQGRHLRSKHDQ